MFLIFLFQSRFRIGCHIKTVIAYNFSNWVVGHEFFKFGLILALEETKGGQVNFEEACLECSGHFNKYFNLLVVKRFSDYLYNRRLPYKIKLCYCQNSSPPTSSILILVLLASVSSFNREQAAQIFSGY
jgi:hypothetical protein